MSDVINRGSSLAVFLWWVDCQGAVAEITQPDDGSGYTCLELRIPGEEPIDVTITEPGGA